MKPSKRPDGRYSLRVQSNGVKKTFYGKTSKECVAKAKLWDGKSSAGLPCKVAMRTWLDGYISTKTIATYKQYDMMYRLYITPVIGILPVGKVIPLNCQNVINAMNKKKLSTATMKHCKKVMHTFFEYERRMKKTISVNPCVDIVVPKSITTRKRRSATTSEIKMILQLLDGTHYYWCYMFLLYTGLRPSEACGIKISDIKGSTIKILETRTRHDVGTGKTDNAEREIHISQGMTDIINMQLSYLRDNYVKMPVYLFPNLYGNPSHSGLLTREWHRNLSGHTDLTLYEIRHTYISLMYDKIPLKQLQEHIGHSSRMDTGTTYAHIFDKTKNNNEIIDDTMHEFISDVKKTVSGTVSRNIKINKKNAL
jgi:integrase